MRNSSTKGPWRRMRRGAVARMLVWMLASPLSVACGDGTSGEVHGDPAQDAAGGGGGPSGGSSPSGGAGPEQPSGGGGAGKEQAPPSRPLDSSLRLEVSSAAPTELTLRWTVDASAVGYVLSRAEGGQAPASCADGTLVASGSNGSVVQSGLVPSTVYSFRLCRALRRADGSSLELSEGATATARTLSLPPGEPSSFAVSQRVGTTDTFDLSWSAGLGAAQYAVVVAADSATAPANCDSAERKVTAATTLAVTGLAPNAPYAFRLCALNDNPTPDASAGVTATAFLHTAAAANPAQYRVARAEADWVTLTWSAPGATGFRFAVAKGAAPADCGTGSVRKVTSAVLTGLAPRTKYGVRVCSANGDREPLFSKGSTFSFTTPDWALPRVTDLRCEAVDFTTELPRVAWRGIGPVTAYGYVQSLAGAASAPSCTRDNVRLLADRSPMSSGQAPLFSFSAQLLGGAVGQSYWLRVCHLTDAGVEQGEALSFTMPGSVGGVVTPGRCTGPGGSDFVVPQVTVAPPRFAEGAVELLGTCNLPGNPVELGGDVSGTTTCTAGGRWRASAAASALPSGLVTVVATGLSGDYRGPAAGRAFVQ